MPFALVPKLRSAWERLQSEIDPTTWNRTTKTYPVLVRDAFPGKLLAAFDAILHQFKVLAPLVRPAVKKANERAALPINRRDVTPLGAVAKYTGVCQVMGLGWSAVLFADDVIDFAAVEGICLGDEALFAQLLRAVSNGLT